MRELSLVSRRAKSHPTNKSLTSVRPSLFSLMGHRSKPHGFGTAGQSYDMRVYQELAPAQTHCTVSCNDWLVDTRPVEALTEKL